MGRGATPAALGTYSKTLNIPASTPAGNYYIGFMLDPLNQLVEAVEYNGDQQLAGVIKIVEHPPRR